MEGINFASPTTQAVETENGIRKQMMHAEGAAKSEGLGDIEISGYAIIHLFMDEISNTNDYYGRVWNN